MDVRLSAEQQALLDAAAGMAARLGPRTVRDLDDAARSARLEGALAASGWRELRTAGPDGEPLASGVEAAIVAEQLATGLADTSFIGPTLAADLRRRAGCEPPPSATHETVAVRRDLSRLATVDDLLAGEAVAVDASGADRALLLVPGPDGYRLAAAGVGSQLQSADLTRITAAVEPATEGVAGAGLAGSGPATEGVAGPRLAGSGLAGSGLSGSGLSGDDLAGWEALGQALACADLVGVMRGAVRLGTEYASARRQFGVPVGSFQAVQHLLADAHVAAEGSASMALHAAWAVDALSAAEARAAASAAKAYCARAAAAVCEAVIQVHGGIGNTWDCPAHVFLRRALLSTDLLGGVGPCLERVLAHRGLAGRGPAGTGPAGRDPVGDGPDAGGDRGLR